MGLVAASLLALALGTWMMPATRHHEVETAVWNAVQDFGGLMGGIALIMGLILERRNVSKVDRFLTTVSTFIALGCLIAWFVRPAINS
jgi:hypothetical protein